MKQQNLDDVNSTSFLDENKVSGSLEFADLAYFSIHGTGLHSDTIFINKPI
jgi:hypothetical protein